jgi:hypothetical protein
MQWILIILTLSKASELKCCIVYTATLLQFILEFQRKFEGTVQWRLRILTFNKALNKAFTIRILYSIYGQVTTVHIGDFNGNLRV